MTALGLRHLRVLLLPMLLVQVGVLMWAWSTRQSTPLTAMSPQDSQMPQAQQRVTQAQQMLARLKAMSASPQRADLSGYLNIQAKATPTPAAAAASASAAVTDYAAMNPGVIRHGRSLKLILGDEVYAIGSVLPGGDRLVMVAADHFLVDRPSTGRIRIPIIAG